LPDALPEQLYNLREDPSQTTNLAAKQPAIAKQMAARLKEIQRQSKSK
jgi:arylsulfatase A-like enzyme